MLEDKEDITLPTSAQHNSWVMVADGHYFTAKQPAAHGLKNTDVKLNREKQTSLLRLINAVWLLRKLLPLIWEMLENRCDKHCWSKETKREFFCAELTDYHHLDRDQWCACCKTRALLQKVKDPER